MNVVPLLGSNLKSDDVIELLEHWDAEVVYDFDRLNENTPDRYHVTAKVAGIELLFDDCQVLITAFLRILPSDGFSAFDIDNSDIRRWSSIHEARSVAKSSGLTATEGQTTFLGIPRDWIRFNYQTHIVHYEFVTGRLNLVTVTLAAARISSVEP
jgi:hypothetical protein